MAQILRISDDLCINMNQALGEFLSHSLAHLFCFVFHFYLADINRTPNALSWCYNSIYFILMRNSSTFIQAIGFTSIEPIVVCCYFVPSLFFSFHFVSCVCRFSPFLDRSNSPVVVHSSSLWIKGIDKHREFLFVRLFVYITNYRHKEAYSRSILFNYICTSCRGHSEQCFKIQHDIQFDPRTHMHTHTKQL